MQCFICLQEGRTGDYLWRYCACEHYCHARCFKTMIRTVPTHRNRCHICKTDYNLKYKSSLVVHCDRTLVAVDVIIILFMAAIGYTTMIPDVPVIFRLCALASLAVLFSMMILFHLLNKVHHGILCPVSIRFKTKSTAAKPTNVYTGDIVDGNIVQIL